VLNASLVNYFNKETVLTGALSANRCAEC